MNDRLAFAIHSSICHIHGRKPRRSAGYGVAALPMSLVSHCARASILQVGEMVREIRKKVFVNWRDTLLMGVPALCYCFQASDHAVCARASALRALLTLSCNCSRA